MPVRYGVILLEYCLVTGLDWWDVVVSFQGTSLEQVLTQLTEGFNKQSPALQQLHYNRYMALKMTLHR